MSKEQKEYIKEIVSSSIATKNALLDSNECIEMIDMLSKSCLKSLQQGGKIIFAGNGGSFGDAQHISAEFIVVLSIEKLCMKKTVSYILVFTSFYTRLQ